MQFDPFGNSEPKSFVKTDRYGNIVQVMDIYGRWAQLEWVETGEGFELCNVITGASCDDGYQFSYKAKAVHARSTTGNLRHIFAGRQTA